MNSLVARTGSRTHTPTHLH